MKRPGSEKPGLDDFTETNTFRHKTCRYPIASVERKRHLLSSKRGIYIVESFVTHLRACLDGC